VEGVEFKESHTAIIGYTGVILGEFVPPVKQQAGGLFAGLQNQVAGIDLRTPDDLLVRIFSYKLVMDPGF